jgi:hypothetical protein
MRTRWLHLATVLGLVLLLAVAPLTVWAAEPGSEGQPPTTTAVPIPGAPTTVRASSGLRLRQGPSLAEPTILILRNGETVYPMAGPVYNQGIAWSFVRVYRWGYYHDGFCAAAYLANYGGYSPTGEHGLKVIAPNGLRLRYGPGLGYGVARTVPYGTILQPTGITQWAGGIQWTKVAFDGVYLWAASMYLQPV